MHRAQATRGDLVADRRTWWLLWGAPIGLLLLGWSVPSFQGPFWSVGLLWIGAACTANALRCRRVHCTIMGPAYLALGLVALANALGVLSLPWQWIGTGALVALLVAYMPEWLGKKYFAETSI